MADQIFQVSKNSRVSGPRKHRVLWGRFPLKDDEGIDELLRQ